jgi:DNA repair/transcription protein MET18/MMS19
MKLISTEITNGQTSLLNVVKALGEYLTSEDGDLRGKGKLKYSGSSFVS